MKERKVEEKNSMRITHCTMGSMDLMEIEENMLEMSDLVVMTYR